MSSPAGPPNHAVLNLISNERMNRELTLPATATHDALNVSYADVGQQPPPQPSSPNASGGAGGPVVADHHPTVLFLPGMFGSRFLGLNLHTIAEKLGVRVLVVDRPGMGRSTNVPLGQRISVWVELVPYLLQQLGIKYVSLVAHSAGTFFLFNTLQSCREILHPDRPFVALLAPWVDVSHSKVATWQAARLIPAGAFGIWNLLPKFTMLQAKPAFAYSGTFFTALSKAVVSSGQQNGNDSDNDNDGHKTENSRRLHTEYGLPRPVQVQLDEAVFKSMFAEDTVGANSEALMCLKKGPKVTWGVCEDYRVFVKQLYATEEARILAASADPEQSRAAKKKLRIRAYFAESDAMIGKRGQAYLTDCFEEGGASGSGSGGFAASTSNASIDFESSTVAGTDHDSIIGMVRVLEEVFVQAGGRLPGSQ